MRQRDEFGFPWDRGKLLPFPTLFGAFDTLLRRGDEIPPDEPRRREMFTAQQHHSSIALCAQRDVRPRRQHRELASVTVISPMAISPCTTYTARSPWPAGTSSVAPGAIWA